MTCQVLLNVQRILMLFELHNLKGGKFEMLLGVVGIRFYIMH